MQWQIWGVSLVSTEKSDLIAGTESWLTPTVYSSELFPTNYILNRKDRDDGYGGVFLACRDALPCEPVHINSRCEIVANRIQLYDHSHLMICCIYRPPNSMEEVIEKYPRDMVWITGDINLPHVDWENNIVQSSSYPVFSYMIFFKIF